MPEFALSRRQHVFEPRWEHKIKPLAGAASGRAATAAGSYAGNQDATDGFARVNVVVTSPAEFFSPANLARIMSVESALR